MVGSNEHAQLREALEFCLEKDLERILLSNPSDPDRKLLKWSFPSG